MNKRLFSLFLFLGCCLVVASVSVAANSYYINPVAFVVNSSGEEMLSFPMKEPMPYKAFTLKAPPRLVLDFPKGVYRGREHQVIGESDLVRTVRSALHKNPEVKTRIVVDLQPGKVVGHRLFYDENKRALQLVFSGGKVAAVAAEKKEQTQPVKEIRATGKKALVSAAPAVKKETKVKDGASPAPQKGDKAAQSSQQEAVKGQEIETPQIRFISFDAAKPGEERVRFRLNGFFPPKISTQEETSPEVICDFPGTSLTKDIEGDIVTGGNLVQRIRVKKMKSGADVRVVLELSQDKNFDLQQIFFRDGNLFVLIVREFAREGI